MPKTYLLSDQEVLAQYPQYAKRVDEYRKLARQHGISDDVSVCCYIEKGFNMKKDAPKIGQCYRDFDYLQSWKFESTVKKTCLVFFLPCILNNSKNKTTEKQQAMLESGEFASAPLIAACILNSIKDTADARVWRDYVRSSTVRADGYRLCLGAFGESGLYCGYCWGGGGVGVFASAVEELETSDTSPSGGGGDGCKAMEELNTGTGHSDTRVLGHLDVSLRDYFAAQAMGDMLHSTTTTFDHNDIASNAYKLADAMIETRKK